MQRQFFGYPFFSPFFSPFFFGGRRFFPTFFVSPFRFPFFRDQNGQDDMIYAQHQVRNGDTMWSLSEAYNVPQPILSAMNSHIQNQHALSPGTTVYIPCMHKMFCSQIYMEEMPNTSAAMQMNPTHMGWSSNMYTGQQAAPNAGTYM